MFQAIRRFGIRPRNNSPIQWSLTDHVPSPAFDTGCTYCQPLSFPSDKQIDYERPLNKSSAIPIKHVMVLTTKDNKMDQFESRIEDWKGTLANEIQKLKTSNKKLHLAEGTSISSIVLQSHNLVLREFGVNADNANEQLVFIYPEMKAVKFDIAHTDQFIKKYISLKRRQPVYNPFVKVTENDEIGNEEDDGVIVESKNFKEYKVEKDLIVTCGHTKRDIRCGELGPLITAEFDKVLTKEKVRDQFYVGQITHIGGHAFAGNVLYYPKECESSRDFIWYGRVFPKDVQGLVEETVNGKRVIKGLFRGDLNHFVKK